MNSDSKNSEQEPGDKSSRVQTLPEDNGNLDKRVWAREYAYTSSNNMLRDQASYLPGPYKEFLGICKYIVVKLA